MTNTFTFVRPAMLAAPLALAAGMAFAGGLASPIETVAPTPIAPAPMMRSGDWSGFYAGGQLGYGKVTSPAFASLLPTPMPQLLPLNDEFENLAVLQDELLISGIETSGDFTGAVYGVHAGYMYDLGAIVVGAEIDYDLTSMEQKFSGLDQGFEGEPVFLDEEFDGTFEVDSILRIKARVGYDAGQFLPYVTGGVVRAELSANAGDDSFSKKIDGDFYGAGIVYKFSDSILIGGEVLQHKFYESDDAEFEAAIKGAGIRATTATARVSFQF